MDEQQENSRSLLKLKRFLEPKARPQTGERCEFCAVEIADPHSHVVNLDTRNLQCACRACYLLFTQEGAGRGKYRSVPQRYLYTREPIVTDPQWDELQIPVGIAFFFFNSALGRMVALYPSPAGATESLLPLNVWRDLVGLNPVLGDLAPDVEALLVYKSRAGFNCYVVPIDACYELVGRVRRHWQGFDGGERAWQEIERFFADVQAKSTEVGTPP